MNSNYRYLSKSGISISMLSFALIFPISSYCQSLKSNYEKGEFLGKCYALGIHVRTADTNATADLKNRLDKWCIQIDAASETFISKNEFRKIYTSELQYLAKNASRQYLMSQASSCTKIIGAW